MTDVADTVSLGQPVDHVRADEMADDCVGLVQENGMRVVVIVSLALFQTCIATPSTMVAANATPRAVVYCVCHCANVCANWMS